ncbi:sigma-54-dependent Fis family transcriptional regulator [Alkaliphilus peptidifermentans]|uniref:PAS domain S-box-containing protein n=1 Tax=Alkaliphilus peptidifermentans DSM 18978 TaxID=1120976 RepID=A0A1G5FK92_9FIRM|nr:sigma 54-interacting transcriptional regulator [Alkaliphilus peptidifermentans]SCY39689.1 PAS domain S-box-containing protein [Alkaliphilus peptidifermentans DSM 18978]
MNKKPYIQRSHQRCIEMGIDYERVYSTKILKDEDLQKKLEQNRELIVTAGPIMDQLYNFVKGSGFFAILTDGEGCILNLIGDEDVLDVAFKLEMIPGAYMDEEHIGTNAMGTALAEGVPVQVSEEEHFITAYHRWTCSGAPIRNNAGEIIGTLDLTGYSHLVHSHTLGMVVAAVNAIEEMFKNNEVNRKLVVAKKSIETIIDSIKAGIFTVGPKGYIKTINKTACEMLGYSQDVIIGMKINNILEGWNGIESSVAQNITYLEEESFVNTPKGKIHCTLSCYPIMDKLKHSQGIVCIIKEIKKMRRLANKMIGKQAIYTFDNIVGRSNQFVNLVNYARGIADSPSTVLIMGESGTGKEVFAQSIHNHSSRRDEPFVALNCGALPRNLIEAELFGYDEGAFTGAKRGGHFGKFELADGGTLFLDEIGEMPLDMQTRLLRVLEEGTLYRIGGNKEIEVDVRIIAATNKDLRREVERGNFRKDLFYRLNVLPLKLIPLRERKDDIPLLIDYFMIAKALKLGKTPFSLSQESIEKMTSYHWPGNVRELENKIEHIINTNNCVIWSMGESLEKPNYQEKVEIIDEKLEDIEKKHIEKILKKYRGNITTASDVLGIGRNTLYRKIDKYSIDCSEMEQCSEIEHREEEKTYQYGT